VTPVVFVHPAGEERREQFILLHPVVEGVDHPGKGVSSPGPFVKSRGRGHGGQISGELFADTCCSISSTKIRVLGFVQADWWQAQEARTRRAQ
jgi:hypothetical protein